MTLRNRNLLKDIIFNPFSIEEVEISSQQTQQFANVFSREVSDISFTYSRNNLKKQKLSTDKTEFCRENLVFGVNQIVQRIQNCVFVVCFQDEVNWVIVQPLVMLCKEKDIPCLNTDFAIANPVMKDCTGVNKLAAIGFKDRIVFPHTLRCLEVLRQKNVTRKRNPFLSIK